MGNMESLERNARRLAALGDDVRRRMYLFVRRQSRPVSREEVGDALGVSRKLAAFHLDKLGGEVRRTRRLGRPGPGRTLAAAKAVLEEHGFEPNRKAHELRLDNCPF